MKVRDQFLKEYQTQVLDSLVLPPCLSAQYSVLSCLKDGERQVYLIRDRTGWPAVLKIQSMGRGGCPEARIRFAAWATTSANSPSPVLSGMGRKGVPGSRVCGRH